MFTILQNNHLYPGSDLINEPPRYSLYPAPPFTSVTMLDLFLLQLLRDPARNARYTPSVEKSAQIAQSLWLSVLPW